MDNGGVLRPPFGGQWDRPLMECFASLWCINIHQVTQIINVEKLIPKLAHKLHYPVDRGLLMQLYWNFFLWFYFKQKIHISGFEVEALMGKSNPESFDYFPPSVFFPSLHLACVSTRIPGWAETKGISIIPVYPCTVFFNISGMSAFIFSVLCYSKNARFAISSQGWAPGKSGMSKGSPRQHPTPSEPNLHLSLESGHGSGLTKHSCSILLKQFRRKLYKSQPFPLALIFFIII